MCKTLWKNTYTTYSCGKSFALFGKTLEKHAYLTVRSHKIEFYNVIFSTVSTDFSTKKSRSCVYRALKRVEKWGFFRTSQSKKVENPLFPTFCIKIFEKGVENFIQNKLYHTIYILSRCFEKFLFVSFPPAFE